MFYLFYKVKTEDIALIKALLEGYEGLMNISTIDAVVGKIQVAIAADFLPECRIILADLGNHFPMIQLAEDPTKSQGNY